MPTTRPLDHIASIIPQTGAASNGGVATRLPPRDGSQDTRSADRPEVEDDSDAWPGLPARS
jgi:hypothetical protein